MPLFSVSCKLGSSVRSHFAVVDVLAYAARVLQCITYEVHPFQATTTALSAHASLHSALGLPTAVNRKLPFFPF